MKLIVIGYIDGGLLVYYIVSNLEFHSIQEKYRRQLVILDQEG